MQTMGIGFGLSASQEALRQRAHEFARAEIVPAASEHDAQATFPWRALSAARQAGLRNLCVPIQHGGAGLGVFEGCLVVEEYGWGCSGFANALTINEVASLPIILAGTEDQKRRWLGALVEGQLMTFALTEPDAGSDLSGMSSTATRRGDTYVLRGTKTLVSNASSAHSYLVFARTDPQAGKKGVSAFIVPREAPGVRVTHRFDKMGQRASDTGEIVFEDVAIPEVDRLGQEGTGFALAMKAFGGARPWTAASALGVGRRALEESVRYSRERQAFGQPIWMHQGVGHKLAEMAMHLEAGRLLTWKAAWALDSQHVDVKLLAYAKTYTADALMKICTDAVQIFGGYGYMREYPVEKLMRDAKAFQLYDGTSEIQRNVIARELCRTAAGAPPGEAS